MFLTSPGRQVSPGGGSGVSHCRQFIHQLVLGLLQLQVENITFKECITQPRCISENCSSNDNKNLVESTLYSNSKWTFIVLNL